MLFCIFDVTQISKREREKNREATLTVSSQSTQCRLKRNKILKPLAVAHLLLPTASLLVPSYNQPFTSGADEQDWK